MHICSCSCILIPLLCMCMREQSSQLHIGDSYLLVTSVTLLFSFSSPDGLQVLGSGASLEIPRSLWFGHHCVLGR